MSVAVWILYNSMCRLAVKLINPGWIALQLAFEFLVLRKVK